MEDQTDSSLSTSLVDPDQEELFDYINEGNKDKIREFLTKNNKIWTYRSKENNNSTILHISVYKKLYEITELFINDCKEKIPDELKNFINVKNDQGVTAIHYASFRGNVKIIKLLIDNGADITIKTNRDLNVIHYACQGNRPNSLMYFYFELMKKNDFSLIKQQDSGGSIPLHWAAYSNAEDVLLYLINLNIFKDENERQQFIDKKDEQGYTPLHLSVTSKSIRIVTKLLQNGATPDIKDNKGKTPLDLAIIKKQMDIADIIYNNQKCQCCNVKAPVKQIKKSIKNIIWVFIVLLLTNVFLFFSIISIAFDTGEGNNNENIDYNIIFIVYMSLLLLFLIIYIILLIRDPGVIKSQPIETVLRLLNQDKELAKYCYKCFVQKTKTSKHCIICNKCYDNFDHHCYWINKCVAQNNYCLFLFFLFVAFFYLSFIFVISILGMIHLLNDKTLYVFKFYDYLLYSDLITQYIGLSRNDFFIHIIINILMILLDLSFLIPETILLVLHINVCCFNYREKRKQQNNERKSIPIPTIETSLMSDTSVTY